MGSGVRAYPTMMAPAIVKVDGQWSWPPMKANQVTRTELKDVILSRG